MAKETFKREKPHVNIGTIGLKLYKMHNLKTNFQTYFAH